MAQENWQQVKEIFVEAVKQQPAARQRFVEELCECDQEIKKEVQSLLSSYDSASSFMEHPAIAEVAQLFEAGVPQLSSGQVFGHYEIVKQIGKGGMGEVYLALDRVLDRKVAIKILDDKFNHHESNLKRFIQEAKAASSLNHPNILVIHEIGEADNTRYIVSEYVEGKTMRDLLRGRSLKVSEALDFATQIAGALAAAHAAHLIHRDIKPENIMIRPDGFAKVLDFGLAKLVEHESRPLPDAESEIKDPNQTGRGMILGTVNYMSPEQAKGRNVDERTDIFSFGVLLFELITGTQPFAGGSTDETLSAIRKCKPPSLSSYVSDMPPELERIVSRTLRKNRGERYQRIRDVLVELQELKQELEFEAKLDLSIQPNLRTSGIELSRTTAVDGSESTGDLASDRYRYISSSNFISKGIKQHKLVSLFGFTMLAVALLGFGYLGYFPGQGGQIESIAVMPFTNAGSDQGAEYLSEGMTETLISSLSQIPNLSVKARSAVFRYKGKEVSPRKIGQELGVQAVLLGRVYQHDDALQLKLELVDTRTQDVVWSEQYDRKQSDLVVLQSEIARDVSTILKSQLSSAEKARVTNAAAANPEAYQAYLRGRYFWNRRIGGNMRKAIDQFKVATDNDPNYALAWVGLADSYALSNEYIGTPNTESLPKAIEYARRAIALDDRLAEPHATLGYVYRLQWKWTDSEREFKKAIDLNPDYATTYHWYSVLLRDLGRFDEAASIIKRGQQADPLSSVIGFNLSKVYDLQGDHQASIENTRKVIELDPTIPIAYLILGRTLLAQGHYAEAVANIEKAVEMSKRDRAPLADLGYIYAVLGRRSEAIAIAKELEEKYARKEANGIYASVVYAGLGDRDKAFEWFQKDIEAKGEYGKIRWDFGFENLRGDPRYKELLKRMGLSE